MSNSYLRKTAPLFLTLLVSFIFLSCNNSYVDDVDRSNGYKYRPGYPEIRMTASSLIDEENNYFILVSSEIVYGSFIYKKVDNKFIANGEIEYVIRDKETKNAVLTTTVPIEVSDEEKKFIYSQKTLKQQQRFKVEAGNSYEILVTLYDQNSQKSTTRETDVVVPDPSLNKVNITKIRILSKNLKNESDFLPVTNYNVESDHDSLKFVFQVSKNYPENLILNTRLIKFNSDTSIAMPMTYNNRSTSSIQYKGIDYSKYKVINTNRRVITTQGNILIEFTFANLKRGNYRFEVISNTSDDEEIFKAREFSVKSKNYPALLSARELARPLYYLMSKKEYEEMIKIKDSESLKKKVDEFWLSNIKNMRKAKEVIELYYQRVEEANKQFSNFKEGWKTDQGMIYILFGPPWYVDSTLNRSVWRYSYNAADPEKNFLFLAPKIQNKYFPFDHFILQRTPQYHSVQYQQIELWLSGLILERNL